jgi:lipopolysaccharide export system protein LptA
MNLKHVVLFSAATLILSCNTKTVKDDTQVLHLNGTWQLVSGTTITKADTTVTDYTKDQSMIKIINDTHFAFLKHGLKPDTVSHFDAGGGRYTLSGDKYTEHLDYYNDKNWEGKTFDFTVTLSNDTLTQRGIEKVEAAGIERVIIEKYVKVK